MTELTSPIYSDEEKAREYLEKLRWPDGPICPRCGSLGERVRALNGASMGAGWFYCEECQDKFTVRVGSVFERSHIPLRKWLMGFRLMAGSKKGVSAHQLHRTLGITYKSAWFMAHRIREAMRAGPFAPPLGGAGKVVEADETYIGRKKGSNIRGMAGKRAVLTLVERGGHARSFHLELAKLYNIVPIVRSNIDKESRLATDEAPHYEAVGDEFAEHLAVEHSRYEYVSGDAFTNTAEGFFSVFKRGMKGVYQHCGEQH
jgi:transposase-like protein